MALFTILVIMFYNTMLRSTVVVSFVGVTRVLQELQALQYDSKVMISYDHSQPEQ